MHTTEKGYQESYKKQNRSSKLHKSTHCQVYKRADSRPQPTNSNAKNPEQNAALRVNIHKLQQYVSELNTHNAQCPGSVVLSGEVRQGLASVFSSCCSMCGHTICLPSSNKVKGPRGYQCWECNLAAVWGGGHSHLQETMIIVGVPVMTKTSFTHTEGRWGMLEHSTEGVHD